MVLQKQYLTSWYFPIEPAESSLWYKFICALLVSKPEAISSLTSHYAVIIHRPLSSPLFAFSSPNSHFSGYLTCTCAVEYVQVVLQMCPVCNIAWNRDPQGFLGELKYVHILLNMQSEVSVDLLACVNMRLLPTVWVGVGLLGLVLWFVGACMERIKSSSVVCPTTEMM